MNISFKDFSMLDHAVQSVFPLHSGEHRAWMEWVAAVTASGVRPWEAEFPKALVPVALEALSALDARLCCEVEEAGEDEAAEAVNDALYIRALQASLETV